VVNLSNLLRQAERKLKGSARSVHPIKCILVRGFVGRPSARLLALVPVRSDAIGLSSDQRSTLGEKTFNFQPTDSVQGLRQATLASGGSNLRCLVPILFATNILHEYLVLRVKRYNACFPAMWKLRSKSRLNVRAIHHETHHAGKR
jgi:hypothetical protein